MVLAQVKKLRLNHAFSPAPDPPRKLDPSRAAGTAWHSIQVAEYLDAGYTSTVTW